MGRHGAIVGRVGGPASRTPVIAGGSVFVHFGSAGTACLDAASGAILWKRQDLPCDHHRGPGSSPIPWQERRSGRHSASPVESGGLLWWCDEDGTTVVTKATPERFELLAENKLDAGCMASPAVIGVDFVVRTKTHLYRIGAGRPRGRAGHCPPSARNCPACFKGSVSPPSQRTD
jgi:hypothetical protein